MRHDNTDNFFRTLFLGQVHARPTRRLRPAIKNQRYNVARVWRNTRYDDSGIERIIRLMLVWAQWLTGGLLVRWLADVVPKNPNLQKRKLWVEGYVLFKLFLPLFFLFSKLTYSTTALVFSYYMSIETVVYLLSLIFLSNEFAEPISSRRSLVTLFVNYAQVSLDYAVVYSHYSSVIKNFLSQDLKSPIKAIYFSFVTSATVGYGDIYPCTEGGWLLVISQIILFLVFVALFINFFAAKLQSNYYITNPKKRVKPWTPRKPWKKSDED